MRIFCVFCSILLFLSGCMLPLPFPGFNNASPPVHGRVIDAKTQKPVEGVTIQFKDIRNKLRTKTLTKSDGSFALKSEKSFYLIIIFTPCPIYYLPPRGPYASFLEISKDGYVHDTIDLGKIWNEVRNERNKISERNTDMKDGTVKEIDPRCYFYSENPFAEPPYFLFRCTILHGKPCIKSVKRWWCYDRVDPECDLEIEIEQNSVVPKP